MVAEFDRLQAELDRLIALSAKAMPTPSELLTLRAIGENPAWAKLFDDLENTPRFDPATLSAPDMLTCNSWGGSRRDPQSAHKLYRRHRRAVLRKLTSGQTTASPIAAYDARLQHYNEAVDDHFRRRWAEAGR
ncbi:hypothetical protein RB623_24210 [Mesorhizobium sp. LHD-90]|uniref:hypothetical protein n=1 Tax=Mesorhizobium sp. LHD-90 TaxID=3071414 RepID=UPI0027E056AD|nr:hypothetical protein [Mesorhizobium sp. LHD-90]MDQ6437169.1 hypothetical protein [Mesorhizobium sp. LHD-90]